MAGSDKRRIQIQEGLSSYLDAMVAVNEFARTIQNDCKSILDTKAAALGKATGLTFNREGIYPESEPYKSRVKEWSGDEAWIGAVLPVANSDQNSDKYHSIDAGLYWKNVSSQSSVSCYSAFYTQTNAFLDELASRLEPQRITKLSVEKQWSGLVLWEPMPLNLNSDYQVELEKLVESWVGIWKRLGGLAGLFTKAQKRKARL